MKNIVNSYVEKFKGNHRAARRTASLLVLLALLVTGGVFWRLHSTGIALTNETTCGLEEHTHTEDCYDEEGNLVCGLTEHVHTAACLSDETADVETPEDWEATIPALTGVWADDVVAIAESQLGYTESTANYTLAEDGETRQGYTRYGAWAGNEYGDWDAMFASFCLYYAGISTEDFPEATGAYAWAVKLQESGLYADAADYTPAAGDLVFFDTDVDGKIDSVGIVEKTDSETEIATATSVIETESAEADAVFYVIEGDYAVSEEESDSVCREAYALDDEKIIGYGVLPEAEKTDVTDEVEADEDIGDSDSLKDADNAEETTKSDTTEISEGSLTYEGDGYIVTVTYGEDAQLPKNTELTVSEYDTDSEKWQTRYEEAAALYGWDEADAYDFRLFDICLILDGEEVEPAADVQVVISFTDKDELTEYTVTHYGDEDTETIDAVSDYDEGTQSVSFDTDGFTDYGLSATANPSFTVQYYAYLDVVTTGGTGDAELTVIDTSGGILPENKSTNNTTTVDLEATASGDYIVATTEQLTMVYSAGDYSYTAAPGLEYINKLAKNAGYEIYQIWVLKSGKSSTSTSESDWTIYTYTSGMDFTNNEDSVDSSKILIEDGAVIRLVYNTVNVSSVFKANLYDYDITDGKLYTSNSTTGGTTTSTSGTVYVNTVRQGINSAANYSGNDISKMLAFGNNNTGTGLADATLNGFYINKTNGSNVTKGCMFGLVTGLSNGIIQYASGVDAPNLFDDGDAIGKTTYSNQDLTFIKEGDTYTLTSVSGSSGVSATGLESFTHLTGYTDGKGGSFSIYTNNFWPMDGVTHDAQDLLFGDVVSYRNGYKKYIYGSNGSALPISDDSLAHNSYFGMQYSVDFTLTADYVGPLNYYFFGDDDMWVFLTDSSGNSRLVCDIGGVHSSVGEYVNLWDYITRGSSGTYTLTFYYTERGASGSTCYMRFTLPSVTSSTPVQDTGTLRVEKEVQGENSSDESFSFTLTLTDSSNNALTDTYAYNIHSSDGTLIDTGTISNDGTFTLKDGQYILVTGLPDGTKCTVTEKTTGYGTSYTVDSRTRTVGTSASATIAKDKAVTVSFLNSTPDVKKKVQDSSGSWADKNTAGIGDIVQFKTTISDLTGVTNLVLHDTLSTGLDDPYVIGVEVVTKDTSGNETTAPLTENTDYTVTYYTGENNTSGATATDGCSFEISFVNSAVQSLAENQVIVVRYRATVTQDAVIRSTGNPNETYISYGTSSESQRDTTVTYVYDINVYKYSDDGALSGAKFILYKTVLITPSEGGNSYTETRYAQLSGSKLTGWTTDSTQATTLETDSDGMIYIKGLNVGTYYLEETEAPNGYAKLEDPIVITIADDDDGTVTYKVDGTDTAAITWTGNGSTVDNVIKVENVAVYELPSTGGPGTRIYTILGSAVCVIAGALYLRRRRRRAECD